MPDNNYDSFTITNNFMIIGYMCVFIFYPYFNILLCITRLVIQHRSRHTTSVSSYNIGTHATFPIATRPNIKGQYNTENTGKNQSNNTT